MRKRNPLFIPAMLYICAITIGTALLAVAVLVAIMIFIS